MTFWEIQRIVFESSIEKMSAAEFPFNFGPWQAPNSSVETVLRRETGYSRINNSDPPPQAI
jgi:hypothetical protein